MDNSPSPPACHCRASTGRAPSPPCPAGPAASPAHPEETEKNKCYLGTVQGRVKRACYLEASHGRGSGTRKCCDGMCQVALSRCVTRKCYKEVLLDFVARISYEC